MDDTVNKLEQMFSGGGESPASGPRRGTSPTTINWGNPKKQEVGTTVHVCVREYTLRMSNVAIYISVYNLYTYALIISLFPLSHYVVWCL